MYKLVNDDTVLLLEKNMFIPFDINNRDYQVYLEWLAAGNTPLPADPIPVPTITLTPVEQALILLLKLSSPSDPADIAEKNDLLTKLNTK